MNNMPNHEDLAPFVNQSCHFEGWHGTLLLAGIEVRQPYSGAGSSRVPFSLLFHGPRGDILPEGYYVVTPDGGPAFAFHIMPIHTEAPDRQEYQAIFN